MLNIYLENGNALIFEDSGKRVAACVKPAVFSEDDTVIVLFSEMSRYNRYVNYANVSVEGTVYDSASAAAGAINDLCAGFKLGGGVGEENKLAMLALQPHLWELDTEIDFGDGTYGIAKRGIENWKTTLSSISILTIPPSEPLIDEIIGLGGYVSYGTNTSTSSVKHYILATRPNGSSPIISTNIVTTRNSNGYGSQIFLYCSINPAINYSPYFIWVRYTKS